MLGEVARPKTGPVQVQAESLRVLAVLVSWEFLEIGFRLVAEFVSLMSQVVSVCKDYKSPTLRRKELAWDCVTKTPLGAWRSLPVLWPLQPQP